MSRFLWKGSSERPSGAKVSWEKVCKPFEEGGLGVRRIYDSNKAALFKLLWFIKTEKSLSWVDWVKKFYLKDQTLSSHTPKASASWQWKNLMSFRHEFERQCVANGEGRWRWRPGRNGEFSISSAYEMVRSRFNEVGWWQLLWNKLRIPKHSFVAWTAMHDRLSTKDRLLRWGLIDKGDCSLCGIAAEDREHLFISCGVAKRTWRQLLEKSYIGDEIKAWDNIEQWSEKWCRGNTLQATVGRLLFGSIVYELWKERNRRFYQTIFLSEESLLGNIVNDIRFKLLKSKKFPRNEVNRNICAKWNLEEILY